MSKESDWFKGMCEIYMYKVKMFQFNNTLTKHRFKFGEKYYTICITDDDWWLEEPVDMSEDMMRAGEEFAIAHRTN